MGLLVRRDRQGFTVLELLFTVVIIGILAVIAIMALLSFKEKAGVSTLTSDLKSAYKMSVQYHTDYPNGTATVDILTAYGFRQSKGVDLIVVDGDSDVFNDRKAKYWQMFLMIKTLFINIIYTLGRISIYFDFAFIENNLHCLQHL